MTKKELAKESLERLIKNHEKYRKWKDKEELDGETEKMVSNVLSVRTINFINTAEAQAYLARLEYYYTQTLHDVHFKEYRESVKDFEAELKKSREKLFYMRADVKEENAGGMARWKAAMKGNTGNAASGNYEREEPTRDKRSEKDDKTQAEKEK